MATSPTASRGDVLRRVVDRLTLLAERLDIEPRSLSDAEQLHDELEMAAGDVRAIVRGTPPATRSPLFFATSSDGLTRAIW